MYSLSRVNFNVISTVRIGTDIVILLRALIYDYYTGYVRHVRLLFLPTITNCIRLVDFAAVGASMWWRSIYPTRIRCINSNQCGGTSAAFVASQLEGRYERASGGGGSPINHPLTNCRTGCFARKCPLRRALLVFLPALLGGAFHLLLLDYARRIPRDMLRRRKHASRGNGGLRCLLEALVSVGANGSPGRFHFRHCRKEYLFAPAHVMLGLWVCMY